MYLCISSKRMSSFYLAFVMSIPFFGVEPALAERVPRRSECPDEWHAIVSKVQTEIVTSNKMRADKLIFVGTDGNVFNCLSDEISSIDLEKIRIEEKERLRFFSGKKENGIPYFYCTIAKVNGNRNSVKYLIYLPYKASELNSDLCIKLMTGAMRFFWP